MREIKFRAVTTEDLKYSDDYDDLEAFFHDCEILPLEQYTGLEDKNGNEIYEGDLIIAPAVFDDDDPRPVMWREMGSVGWVLGKLHPGRARYALNGSSCYLLEVIGNIHENPELLD